MNLLVCVGEGLGNVIQTLPMINLLRINGISFDILNLSSCSYEDISFIFNEYANVVKTVDPIKYDHILELPTTYGNLRNINRKDIPGVVDPRQYKLYHRYVNEVELYIAMVTDNLGISFYPECFNVSLPETTQKETFDFVVHNGCSLVNPHQWKRKKYPHMVEVTNLLLKKNKKVGTIGTEHEYENENTTNCTGKSLEETTKIIRSGKVFISNDTGTYHLAAALQKKGLVIFTATSVLKNYHHKFHKTIKVVSRNEACQPCQYTDMWEKCTPVKFNKWACQNVLPETILKEIYNA